MSTPSITPLATNDANETDQGFSTMTLPTTPGEINHPANDNDDAHHVDADEAGSSGGLGFALLCIVSVGIHVAVLSGVGRDRTAVTSPARRPRMEVTMTVASRAAADPPASPSTVPAPAKAPPASRPDAHRRAAPLGASRPTAGRSAPAPAVAETPADFSGVTLTNDGQGPGWASAVGDGSAMRGPIGTPGAKVTGRSRAGSAGEGDVAGASRLVPLGSLSRAPIPPDLNAALERHYPPEARRQGTPGQAVLRGRILADGHVRDLVVVSQSAAGFGDACRATLRDSTWSAPLDKAGEPVATFVTYTCRFEVR